MACYCGTKEERFLFNERTTGARKLIHFLFS